MMPPGWNIVSDNILRTGRTEKEQCKQKRLHQPALQLNCLQIHIPRRIYESSCSSENAQTEITVPASREYLFLHIFLPHDIQDAAKHAIGIDSINVRILFP